MKFKTRTVTQIILIYGYDEIEDTEYSLSFLGKVSADINSVEFLNLISTKNLTLNNFKELFQYVNEVVKKLGYKQWFMDVLPENRGMADRFKPIKEKEIIIFNEIKLIRFWYEI